MRIVIFDDRYGEVYGAQENALILAQVCAAQGHDVHFLTTRDGLLSVESARRDIITEVETAPERLQRFERELLVGGPLEVLKTALAVIGYSWRLHRSFRRQRVDLVVAAAVRPAVMLLVTGLVRRPKVLLWSQNSTPLGAIAFMAGLISWRIGLISDGARTTFGSWSQRMFEHKFRSLPSGRDFGRFTRESPVRTSDSPLRIVTICSITPRKGLHLLIDAISDMDVPDVRLQVVGGTTGPKSEHYLDALLSQVSAKKVNVDFVGWQDDVVPFLAQADIFALASEHEGLPGVLLEAMASGTACVTTRAGGAGDLVEQCDAGIAVDVGDQRGMTMALERIARDTNLRGRFASNGYRNVRSLYGLGNLASLFDLILAEQRAGGHDRHQ